MYSLLAVRKLTRIPKSSWKKLAERLERLAVNAKVATVLFSILASSDALKIEVRQMKQC